MRGFLRCEPGRWLLQIEALEIGAKLITQVGAIQREVHGGLEESQLFPGVMPLALELDGVDAPAPPQGAKAVGQLDLPPRIRRCLGQDREKVRVRT
jgi:hypothetical protein